ncbi:Imm74 family immunity protein [Myroides odoratus]|uniref:Imm74 family immunity protein n=1 Tax=Myroides odoratus TaxID=256 RepID=UPI0039AF06A4
MNIKNIKGTRNSIEVEIDNKVIIITGELTATPIFYADIDSIIKWESPHEQKIITENEKKEISNAIESESKNKKVPVVFD